MRAITLLLSLIIYASTVSGEANLLIDAISLPETSKQPTWLGVRKNGRLGRLIHFPTKQSLIPVAPGRYKLHHIDFDRSKHRGSDTIFAPDGGDFVFEARQDSINYVGLVTVEREHPKSKRSNVSLEPAKILFEWVCDKNPEIFKRLPVKFIGEENADKELRINCET